MAIKVKIYDFQFYSHETFTSDLLNFLFLSVKCNDLRENFRIFIDTHHAELTKTLKLANCSLDDYPYEK